MSQSSSEKKNAKIGGEGQNKFFRFGKRITTCTLTFLNARYILFKVLTQSSSSLQRSFI